MFMTVGTALVFIAPFLGKPLAELFWWIAH